MSLALTAVHRLWTGLGGLGLRAACWLLNSRSANYLALASRSGKVARSGQGSELVLEHLWSAHAASLHLQKCDVGQMAEVAALVDASASPGTRTSTVLHMTEVLHDRLLYNNHGDLLRQTFAPKAVGASHLHAVNFPNWYVERSSSACRQKDRLLTEISYIPQ